MTRRSFSRYCLSGFYIFVFLISILFFAPPSDAFSGDAEILPNGKIWQTDAVMRIENENVTFEIDKNAKIILNLPKLKRIKLEYSAEGSFKLEYISYRKNSPPVTYKPFVRGYALRKGEGTIVIDLRHTENWGIDSIPVFSIRGNGNLKFKKLFTETISLDDGSIASQKDSGFFWMPERYTHNMVNSITPVFWSYSDKTFFMSILGIMYVTAVLLAYLYSYRKNSTDFSKALSVISVAFACLFMVHFGIRFYPTLHTGLFLSSEEKLNRNYIDPELGSVINAANKYLASGDRVIVLARGDDWFAKESICFYISDKICTYKKRQTVKQGIVYEGHSRVDRLKWKDVDAVISYNSSEDPQFNFRKVWELNDNVFIGIKQ